MLLHVLVANLGARDDLRIARDANDMVANRHTDKFNCPKGRTQRLDGQKRGFGKVLHDARRMIHSRGKETLVTMFKLGNRGLWRTALALGILALVVLSGPSTRTNRQAGLVHSQAGNLMVMLAA